MKRQQKENIIEIKEEVKIQQEDKVITLEKGDKIKIFEMEVNSQNAPEDWEES